MTSERESNITGTGPCVAIDRSVNGLVASSCSWHLRSVFVLASSRAHFMSPASHVIQTLSKMKVDNRHAKLAMRDQLAWLEHLTVLTALLEGSRTTLIIDHSLCKN